MSLVSSIVSSPSSSSPSATRNLTFILLMICFYFVSYLVAIVECSDNNITITKIKAPLHHPLTIDYYSKTCPQLDDLVGSVTGPRFKQTPVAGPATIRLFFHDCFVEGCDASILIAPGAEGSALVERNMPENKNLPPEGFETVEMAKKVVESKCPGAVSCADILAIAARDFIHLAGGPYYKVKKGRKDSKKSKPFKVKYHLPRSNSSISSLLSLFSSKGLTARDLVAALQGATHRLRALRPVPRPPLQLPKHRQTRPLRRPRLLKSLQMYCRRRYRRERRRRIPLGRADSVRV
ncbi:uncharacterized protein A4U43_C05F28780 [Asparagus officinalis]|uniref:Peroxidase n=1 Tax=Asparagus officinalis TaxID=4686 RepID=A0A5P1EWS4_ASPOF|nr:uncharacterized protein A4U43_C05F28780 [Asparagus officinalis]